MRVGCMKKLREAPASYHKPLLLTLVNSVNTSDADLKLFFAQLELVGRGKVRQRVWAQAKSELWDELGNGLEKLSRRYARFRTTIVSIA